MSEAYSAAITVMLDRVAALTPDQAEDLAALWFASEDLEYYSSHSVRTMIGNTDLVDAWNRALHAGEGAGRGDDLDAAIAAGKVAHRCVRHFRIDEGSKTGAEQAVRAAVLAVGRRDLLTDADYQLLVSPWTQVLGAP